MFNFNAVFYLLVYFIAYMCFVVLKGKRKWSIDLSCYVIFSLNPMMAPYMNELHYCIIERLLHATVEWLSTIYA